MTIKIIKSLGGIEIPFTAITDVHLCPEEFTGDGEYDKINFWRIHVIVSALNGGGCHKIFEAEDFDCCKETFYYFDAVKGNNYKIVHEKYKKLKLLVEAERMGFEKITL